MQNDPYYATTHKTALARFVMLFVALLVAMLVYVLLFSGKHGDRNIRAAATITELQQIDAALQLFNKDTGRYPTAEGGLAALVAQPQNAQGWQGPYLKKIPLDRWGHEYTFTLIPNLHSIGKDGIDGTSDDLTKDSK